MSTPLGHIGRRCIAQNASKTCARSSLLSLSNARRSHQPLRVQTIASGQRLHSTSPRHSQSFSPLVPPNPLNLPKAQPAKHYRRTRKWLRRLFYLSSVLVGAHLVDRQFLHSSLTRSARTFALAIVVAIDYKISTFAAAIASFMARLTRPQTFANTHPLPTRSRHSMRAMPSDCSTYYIQMVVSTSRSAKRSRCRAQSCRRRSKRCSVECSMMRP
jgi:hypothetical protein